MSLDSNQLLSNIDNDNNSIIYIDTDCESESYDSQIKEDSVYYSDSDSSEMDFKAYLGEKHDKENESLIRLEQSYLTTSPLKLKSLIDSINYTNQNLFDIKKIIICIFCFVIIIILLVLFILILKFKI